MKLRQTTQIGGSAATDMIVKNSFPSIKVRLVTTETPVCVSYCFQLYSKCFCSVSQPQALYACHLNLLSITHCWPTELSHGRSKGFAVSEWSGFCKHWPVFLCRIERSCQQRTPYLFQQQNLRTDY